MHKVKIHFGVAIPVGHQVDVQWPEMGGGPHQPVVKDLDTGVVWAPAWACENGELLPRRALQQVRGVVQACLMVQEPGNDSFDTVTWLTIDDRSPTYR